MRWFPRLWMLLYLCNILHKEIFTLLTLLFTLLEKVSEQKIFHNMQMPHQMYCISFIRFCKFRIAKRIYCKGYLSAHMSACLSDCFNRLNQLWQCTSNINFGKAINNVICDLKKMHTFALGQSAFHAHSVLFYNRLRSNAHRKCMGKHVMEADTVCVFAVNPSPHLSDRPICMAFH